jgi:hypothetical protein
LSSAGQLLQHHNSATAVADAESVEEAGAAQQQQQQQGTERLEQLSLPCDMQTVALALQEMQAVNTQLQRLEQHLQLEPMQPEQPPQQQQQQQEVQPLPVLQERSHQLDEGQQQQLGFAAFLQEQLHQQHQEQQQLLASKQPHLLEGGTVAQACIAACPSQCSGAAAAMQRAGLAETGETLPLLDATREGNSDSSSLMRLQQLQHVTQALLAGVQEQQGALQLQQQEAMLLCQQAEAAAAAAAYATAAGLDASNTSAAPTAATEDSSEAEHLTRHLRAAEQQRAAVQASMQQITTMALQLQATEQQLLKQQRQILLQCRELSAASEAVHRDTQQAPQAEYLSSSAPQQQQQQQAVPGGLVQNSSARHPASDCHSMHSGSSKAGSLSKPKAAGAHQQHKVPNAVQQGFVKSQLGGLPCRPNSAPHQLQGQSQSSSSTSRRSSSRGRAGVAAKGSPAAASAQVPAGKATPRLAAAVVKQPAAKRLSKTTNSARRKIPVVAVVATVPDAASACSKL